MATSPNYGWLEPDNTDLVKNGALAIRTLGNAIDTTMATMTPKSTVTTKGDLVAATAASTPARLAVGNNGETLVADSSTSTGLRYTAGNAQGNPVLNSAFQIWQRGTTGVAATITGAYFADRWVIGRGVAGATGSRQATNDTTNLPNIQYCARVQRDSGNTSTSAIFLAQSFETINSIPFAGKTVTVSFYARAGANYSSASNALSLTALSGTGTDQQVLNTYTSSSTFASTTATLTTTWQRFSATGTISATANEIAFYFNYTPSGTAGANDYFEITGVQIDIGSVALPFRTYAATIQGELAACQRYYTRESVTTTYAYFRSSGNATNTTQARIVVPLPVQMRTKPAAMDIGGSLAVSDGVNLYGTGSFVLSANSTTQNAQVEYTHGSAVFTQYRYESLQDNNNGSTYLGFSAEL